MDSFLEAISLTKTFLDSRRMPFAALEGISLTAGEAEFLTIVGPSGCGKTTLLRLLGGLEKPTSGEVRLRGELLVAPRREIGFVFQRANLMPWRTVLRNIALPLEVDHTSSKSRGIHEPAPGFHESERPAVAPRSRDSETAAVARGLGKPEAAARAASWVSLMGLDGFADAYPNQISGGMQQRVALARALIHEPSLLLLDEPFGSLDALTRERMNSELLRIWSLRRPTVVMVTHSISEAVLLADRVLVMSPRPGRIRAEFNVPFPRPRELALTGEPEFTRFVRTVRAEIVD